MNIFKLIIRGVLVASAAFITTVVFILSCIGTGATQCVNWVFNKHSYWDLSNEWFMYKQEMLGWYKTFLDKDGGDW